MRWRSTLNKIWLYCIMVVVLRFCEETNHTTCVCRDTFNFGFEYLFYTIHFLSQSSDWFCSFAANKSYSLMVGEPMFKNLQITKLNAPKYDTAIFDIIFGENHFSFRLELSYKRMLVKICKILSFVRVPCFLHKYRLFKSQFWVWKHKKKIIICLSK